MNFIVTRKSDGAEVIRYSAAMAQEVNGFDLIEYDHTEYNPDEPVPVSTKRRLTKQEFFDKLGGTAVDFLLTAAKTEVSVEAWIKRLDIVTPDPDGTSVDLDDPRTIQGVTDLGALMVSMGVVDSEWANEVLNG